MRCRACNVVLTDFESTRKSTSGNYYLDLCNRCFGPIVADIDTTENYDLFDGDRDDLTSIIPTGDETPDTRDKGAGPDGDEPDDPGFHPADES